MKNIRTKGLGTHFLAEYYNCNRSYIDDLQRVKDIMSGAVKLSKATLIKAFYHKFSPQGVSGIVIIAESHFAIHTWPEYNYSAVDLFSCSDFDFQVAFDYIKKEIEADRCSITSIERGILPEKGRGPLPLELNEIFNSN